MKEMDEKRRGAGKRGKGDDDGDDTEQSSGIRKRMKNGKGTGGSGLRNNTRGGKKKFSK